MNFERMPEIPGINHPEYRDLKDIAKEKVLKDVTELNVGLELDRHPKILDRLTEIGSHFEDSLAMAQIIQSIHGKLRTALNLHEAGPERMMRAAILHDIGKSGPSGEETTLHDVIRRLFADPIKPFNPFDDNGPKTIAAYVEQQDLNDAETVLATLRKNGIDPENEAAIDFWRRHADWSYDILKSETGEDIDDETAMIVGSHHILEGKNPAGLKLNELPAEAHVLETLELAGLMAAVDKYQAFRDRSGLGHRETISRLRKLFSENQNLTDEIMSKFITILDILDDSGNDLDQYFDKAA